MFFHTWFLTLPLHLALMFVVTVEVHKFFYASLSENLSWVPYNCHFKKAKIQ